MSPLDHTWVYARSWDDPGWGLVTRKTNHKTRGLGLGASLTPTGRGAGDGVETCGQWFSQLCLCNEIPLRTLDPEALLNAVMCWSGMHPDSTGSGYRSSALGSFIDFTLCLFIWLVLICILYKKTIQSIVLFWALSSSELTLKKVMCYRLDVCVAPKFICWNLTLNVMVLEVIRLWGWSPHEWDYCSYKRPTEFSHPFCHDSRKTAVWEPASSSYQTLTLPAPGSWTSSLPNWKNKCLLFKLHSLWCFYYSSPA